MDSHGSSDCAQSCLIDLSSKHLASTNVQADSARVVVLEVAEGKAANTAELIADSLSGLTSPSDDDLASISRYLNVA